MKGVAILTQQFLPEDLERECVHYICIENFVDLMILPELPRAGKMFSLSNSMLMFQFEINKFFYFRGP